MANKWVKNGNGKKAVGMICVGLLCGICLYAMGNNATAKSQEIPTEPETEVVSITEKYNDLADPNAEKIVIEEIERTKVGPTTTAAEETVTVCPAENAISESTTYKEEETTVLRSSSSKVFTTAEKKYKRITYTDTEEAATVETKPEETTTEAETTKVETIVIPETTTEVEIVIGEPITRNPVEETSLMEEMLPSGFLTIE